jgi:hypothetical protein
MTILSRDEVLAPFAALMSNCQNNVLIGLRLAERAEKFPEPTPEELKILQVTFGENLISFDESKALFRKWLLLNGFEEIHKCLRTTLEALYVFKRIEHEAASNPALDEHKRVKQLRSQARSFKHPQLVAQINLVFREPLEFQTEINSFNSARNCLVHANGVVARQYCNNEGKNKLIIYGRRMKLFFKKGELEVPAEIGATGPENAALLLGAEDFQIEFVEGQALDISLKQFREILSTCVFIHVHLAIRLSKKVK